MNEKLISTLATERLIADSAAKTRGEGSPTSTNSSTSTLKGDESAENIPSLVQEQQNSSLSSSVLISSKKDVTATTKDVSATTKVDTPVKKEPLTKKLSADGVTLRKEALTKKEFADGVPITSGHSHSFEGPTVITRSYGRYDSATVDRRSKTPLTSTTSDGSTKDYLSRSFTLDRRRETGGTNTLSRSVDRDPILTSTSLSTTPTGRSGRGLSKQAAEDLLALDPKTIQSLEKLKKLTAGRKSPRPKTPDPPRSPPVVTDVKRLSPHVPRRPTTPEPQSPPLTDVKLLHSPERRRRRKSEGMHPIEKQAGGNFVPCEKTLHEGDEQEQEQEKEVKKEEPAEKPKDESKAKGSEEMKKESSKPTRDKISAPEPAKPDLDSKPSNDRKRESKQPAKPAVDPKQSSDRNGERKGSVKNEVQPNVGSKKSSDRNGESKLSVKNEVLESKRSPSPTKEIQRSISPIKTDKSSDVEKKTTTSSSLYKSTSPKLENGDRSPSPKKRISSSSSNEDSNTTSSSSSNRSVTISSFTRSTPIDRMWSDFKKEDDNGSRVRTSPRSNRYQRSSQDSVNDNDSPTHSHKRRYVTRERFLDDARSSFKIKPGSTAQDSGSSPQTSRSSSPTKNRSKEEVKSPPTSATKPSARMEFGTCYSIRTKSPPGGSKSGSFKKGAPKSEEVKIAKPDEAPGIVVQPPSVDESSNNGDSSPKTSRQRDIRVRQKSPVSDMMKHIKANRRKTPVISEDALAAILSGDIPDEALDDGTCPLSPSQTGDPRMTLETCPEEDEEPKKYFSSPTRSRKNVPNSSNSPEQAPSPQRNPEKKVTINSEPCIRRVSKRHMLSCDMRERTKSLTSFSPERSLSPTSPRESDTIPEEDELSTSSNLLALPIGRLRTSSLVMSRSTPDLSEILGPNKKNRKARRIERSNSKRRVKGDSYVTSTTPNATYNPLQSSGSFSASRSSSRILSGSRISKFTSVFTRKDKDRSEKDSSSRHSEKSSKRL